MPYWLFKKDDGLSISRYDKPKRFDGAKTIENLIGKSTKEYRNDYLTKMLDPDVEKYLKSSDKDKLFDTNFTNFKRSAKFRMEQ